MAAFKDISGTRFGKLTAVWPEGRTESAKQIKITYLCICSCGSIIHAVRKDNLVNGLIQSCGCTAGEKIIRHGAARRGRKSPEYIAFIGARQRCMNPNSQAYAAYGGSGIEFRFKTFEEFLGEIGPRPGPEYSDDRIDPNGHYEPGNVRWATREIQAINKREIPVGVCLETSGRWRAQISVRNKKLYLGTFDTLAEARQAYKSAAENRNAEYISELEGSACLK